MLWTKKAPTPATAPTTGRRVVISQGGADAATPATVSITPAANQERTHVETAVREQHVAPAVRSVPVAPRPAAEHGAKERLFAGLRTSEKEIETTLELAKVNFHQIINEKVKLGPHLYARIAVAQVQASSKNCIFFVDKHKVNADDIKAIVDLVKQQGYSLQESGPAIFYAVSTLIMALSQGHMDSARLTLERDIARDPAKNSLMASFTDIISWAYVNNADDIDFAVDITSGKSQIAFKIGGRYIRPERYLLPTETLIQMLGIAWQKSTGGASAQFEIKTEQQAQVSLDLPPGPKLEEGARVRLRWSGLANDKGTTVTMRLQRLGESALIRSLEAAGYLESHMEILRRVIHSEGGMVVLSGVVGSGKSTSLVGLIKMLPTDIKIVSMEDPVELDIPLAYQKTITRDLTSTSGTDPAFASATRGLYRSAMDVLYLGEIRDPETGLVARQVAESGHSVYTTTHARSGLGIVDRFASPAIGIPRDVLATPDILKLLVYQALLPTTCPHCGQSPDMFAREQRLNGRALDEHKKYFDRLYRLYGVDPENYRLRNANGCEHCIKEELPELNGFSGRTVVAEMIEPDEEMLKLILGGNNVDLKQYWRSLATPDFMDPNLVGKTTMECAVYKAAIGKIDPREIEPRFMSFETVEAKNKFAEGIALGRHGARS